MLLFSKISEADALEFVEILDEIYSVLPQSFKSLNLHIRLMEIAFSSFK